MKRIFALTLIFVSIACSDKSNFKLSKNTVGKINNTTTIADLKEVFKNDSIVSRLSEGEHDDNNSYIHDNDSHLIYDKETKELLLSITPINPLDSLSTIKCVTVFNEKFQTKSNTNINSSFVDLKLNHTISKVEASFHLCTIFLDDINATATIDKLAIGLKPIELGKVEIERIPENTPITSLTFWFE